MMRCGFCKKDLEIGDYPFCPHEKVSRPEFEVMPANIELLKGDWIARAARIMTSNHSTASPEGICDRCHKKIEVGQYPFCPHDPVTPHDVSIHTSERVVVNYNPQTGETRIPGRADRPLDPKYAAAGYERRELGSLSEVRKLEKSEGLVHEASNYDRNGTETRETGSR